MNKCGTCKFWWPNTPKGVVEEANRRLKHRCLAQTQHVVGGKTDSCRNFKKFKPFFMVPWDEKTFIKIEASSKEEMLQKVGVIARKIADPIAQAILMGEEQPPRPRKQRGL